MRLTSLILAAGIAVTAPSAVAASQEVPKMIKTSVGKLVMLKLPGNPRAGYKWQLNKKKSKGLKLVTVDQIGWIMAPEARSMFFSKASILNVGVKGLKAGEANLAFDYYRTWGSQTSVRTSMVKVIVEPKAKKTAAR